MGLVYGVPFKPPVTSQPDWGGMDMLWTGWDGSEWVISDQSQGVVLLSGVRGLNMPQTRPFLSVSSAVHGSRQRGWRADEREVFWPLKVFSKGGSAAWLAHERAFWRTMHPDRPGVWRVSQQGGESRTLTARFRDDGGQAFDTIPSLTGWQHYGIYLAAEQPFWAGQPVTGTWAASPPQDFFDGSNGGPVFVISSGSTFDKATLSNAGDVEAWPVYTVAGPSTAASVGGVTVPFEVPAGKAVRIDTAPGPTSQTALFGDWDGKELSNTVDRTKELGTVDFSPIQPGEDRKLTISLTGAGQITVEFTPLYFRAW